MATDSMAAIATKSIQYLSAVVVTGMSALLVLSNPGESAYSEFATQQTVDLLLRDICQANQQQSDVLEKLWGNSCKTLSVDSAADIQQFVTYNTQRQNLWLFSLYTTELPLHSLKVLGIANQFVVLSFTGSQNLNSGRPLPENAPLRTARPLHDR
ncbi:DUF4359 domain-containing protein [Acaryochloris thomasi]|nr:DUF4359 domain-containing protein [Acaryochloris thomasi]